MGSTSQRTAWVVFTVLMIASFALGQRDLGTIVGTVADQSGALVPNAKVDIVDDNTGVRYSVTTDNYGAYVRPLLQPGTYSVSVDAAGFRRVLQHNVVVTPGSRVPVPITLRVGASTESVEVIDEIGRASCRERV